jgi:ribosomal protein S3AE
LKQTKVKKKRWYTIVGPKFLGEKQIGESYLNDPNAALGRTVNVNLMQITGDIKSQSSAVKFEISEFEDNKFHTRIISYNYSPSSIRRLVRRRMTRVDDSLVVSTKDNKKVRIKPFLLTRGKVSNSVKYKLRISLKEELTNLIKKTSYKDIFNMIIKHKLQREFKDKLNKVYPLKALEIRVLQEEKLYVSKVSTKKEKKLVPEDKEELSKETKEKTETKEEKVTKEEKKEQKSEEKKTEKKKQKRKLN